MQIDRKIAASASIKQLLRMVVLLLITILVLTGCNRKAMQLGMRKTTQENIDANVASISDQLANLELLRDHAEGKNLMLETRILRNSGRYGISILPGLL